MKEVQKRRRKKGIVWMPVMLLCVVFMAGCGSSGGLETISIESIEITQNRTEEAPGTEASSSEQAEESREESGEEESAQPSEAAAAGDVFYGEVEEIAASGIRASETYTEDLGDGGMLAVSPGVPDPADFVEVTYTEETIFIIRSSPDMGMTHSDRKGRAEDLEVGKNLVAAGTREGNIFRAKEIVIYHFT